MIRGRPVFITRKESKKKTTKYAKYNRNKDFYAYWCLVLSQLVNLHFSVYERFIDEQMMFPESFIIIIVIIWLKFVIKKTENICDDALLGWLIFI